MKSVLIVRTETSLKLGTFGDVSIDGAPFCKSVERSQTISEHPCIPAGKYHVDPVDYGSEYAKPGRFYTLRNVPGRDHILIHSANWWEELLGCIALGAAIQNVQGEYEGQAINHRGVTSSIATVEAFQNTLGWAPFEIEVRWAPGVGA